MLQVEGMEVLNGTLSMVVSVLAGALVLSKRIPDRLIARLGLVFICLGQFVAGSALLDAGVEGGALVLLRAQFFVRLGLVLVASEVIWRVYNVTRRLAAMRHRPNWRD